MSDDFVTAGHALQVGAICLNVILVLVILPIRGAIDALKKSDDELKNELAATRIEMAKEYVRRGELNSSLSDIRVALERIERRLYDQVERLDHSKADK